MPLLLLASLAVNLFAAGMLAARFIMPPPPPPPRGPEMMSHFIREMAAELDGADRAVVETVLHAHEATLKQRSAALGEARDGIRQMLRHEPFDRAGLEAALDEAGRRDQALRQIMQDMLVETAAQLSPDGRRRVSDWGPPRPR
jgi:Spy/CpxP family protein refolding chaperone